MRAHEILTEAQIVNMPQVKIAVGNLSDDPRIKAWLTSKFPKWLATLPDESIGRDYDDDEQVEATLLNYLRPLRLSERNNHPEAWVRNADPSKPVYEFNLNATRVLLPVIDWLRQLEQTDPPVFARLDRINLKQAMDAQEQWHRQLAKQKATAVSAEALEGSEKVLDLGDYSWWKLTTEAALKHEGACMGHCVGSYGWRVESGKIMIFSLRDKAGRSHVTVEVQDQLVAYGHPGNYVVQVKGKENKPPLLKYAKMFLALKDAIGSKWTYGGGREDLERAGLYWSESKGDFGEFLDVAKPIGTVGEATLYADIPEKRYDWETDNTGAAKLMHGSETILTMPLKLSYRSGDWSVITNLILHVPATREVAHMIWPCVTLLYAQPQRFRTSNVFGGAYHNLLTKVGLESHDGKLYPKEEMSDVWRSEIEAWLKDRSLNGYGAINSYICSRYFNDEVGDIEDVVAEAKKMLPKQKSKLAAQFEQTNRDYVFLHYDAPSKTYWFFDLADVQIFEMQRADLMVGR